MANRVKWLIGTIVACIVIVLFVRSIDVTGVIRTPSFERDGTRILNEIAREERLLREAVWADSLLPRIPTTAGLHVDLAHMRNVGDTTLRRIIAAEWEHVDVPAARVAVFAIPDTLGAYSSNAATIDLRAVYFAGADEDGPYCAVVVPVAPMRGGHTPSGRFDQSILGPCLWWGQYGVPGAGIGEWLRSDNGYRLGARLRTSVRGPVNVSVRRLFAQGTMISQLSPFAMSCMESSVQHCEQTVTDQATSPSWGSAPGQEGLAIYRSRHYYGESHFGGREHYMLAELEHEFGRERFAQFWRSDGDVASAFERAFGTPLGRWVQHWARTRFAGMVDVASNGALTFALAALTLLVLSGVAVIGAHRRQVR